MTYSAGHLIGRENEMAELARLAASAVAGEGQAAFVVGEAGVGKTALLELAAGYAGRSGMQVLHAAAQELERQRPFAVISSCLGVEAVSADPSRARVAEVLRGDARYGLPGALGGSGEADFATVEAMLSLVDELCARGATALFLDDLQWADPASLLVVRRLMGSVHQLPLLVVGAYRQSPRVKEVDQLSQSLGVRNRTVLKLAPLSVPAVTALLTALCGGEPGPRLRSMAEAAAGNPLYVKELSDALLREALIKISGGFAEVTGVLSPPPLPTLITHRLSYLSDDALHALRVAAVLGASCTVTEFAAVLGKSTHDVVSIVAEAEAAGVLRDTGDRLVFHHDLIRHALSDAVSGSVRAMVHLKAAQAIAGAGATPERVAEHLLNGAPAGEFLIAWLVEFAPRLTTRAPVLALHLLDKAVGLAYPSDPRYDDLQLHRAVAQLSCGHLTEAEESARCVLARTSDPGMESPMHWIIIQAAFARSRPDLALAEARTACQSEGLPVAERRRFDAFSSVCLFALGDLREAGAHALAARRTAQEVGDAHALAYALQILAAKRFLEEPGTEALELARQACRLTPETIHPAQRIALQLALANSYTELDRSHDTERTLAAAHKATEHVGGVFLPWYHLSCALLAFNTGRWDDALAEVEAGLNSGESFAMSRALRAIAALIAVRRGRQDAAEAHLTAVDPARDPGAIACFYEYLPLCANALLDEARSNTERAYSRLMTAFDDGIGHLPGQLILGFLAPDIVRLALAHGDTANARRVASAAQTRADHSRGPYHLGDAYRCQGLLARDPQLFLEAARCYRNAPRPLHEAHAYTDAAELLAQRRQPAEARALLDQALEIYGTLEADWETARALYRLRSLSRGVRRRCDSPREGWSALTNTERIVAEHVAHGRSNPEIATHLSIARRTVSSHVSNILRKLKMTSRVELATEFVRRLNSDEEHPHH
ncbi:AAA family ATPase [Streptomyces lydicamycinicus]|uniref:ATP-binding protein n=1 Tax=Streptomyces lydicamycinicus TaxID=1546107 RepID=UPI002034CF2B|nr:LuxR family transcriptional regulator [Streptomyces lydicamycinicus]USA00505.1 AAA family ATPase [Streptomyces lydicamycinicus]